MIKKWTVLTFIALSQLLPVSALAENLALKADRSEVYFTTIKKGSVAETHQIKILSGGIKDGKVDIALDLSSVDTHIQIRDTRVKKFLFETELFPTATYSSQIDIDKFTSLEVGESIEQTIDGSLNLHGFSKEIKAEANISKMKDGSLQVFTTKPIIINASDFNLVKGVDKLREIAGLPSISYAVPVNFTVVFK